MGSRKRSAQVREIEAFKAQLGGARSVGSAGGTGDAGGGLDDLFAREEERRRRDDEEHDRTLRHKACESKNRYATRAEAEAAIVSCAAHGTRGLHCYRCDYCGGWHLTSKPQL